jgi:phage/plasmid-associated DNA primase
MGEFQSRAPGATTWQHPDYPDKKIVGMDHSTLCAALDELQCLPRGSDLMNVDTLRETLTQAARAPKVHERYEMMQRDKAAEKERGRRERFTRTTRAGVVHLEHVEIAAHLYDEFNTVSFNKTLFIYDKESGIYRENAGDLEQAIRIIIEETGVKCSITRDTRDILAYLLATNPRLEYPFNQVKDLIPLENGVLKLNSDTGASKLLPHGSEYLFTYRIPVTYDTSVEGNEARDLLRSWVEPEDVSILIQIAAQAVLQAQLQTTYKKSYIIQGEPHAGKSTYIEFLTGFFGNDQISSRSLQSLCDDRFVAGDLEGKILNIYDDLSEIPLENVGTFKAFTGSCRHNVERKGRQSYKGTITCPHVFTCNHPPKYPDDVKYDAAFWERWEYVSFPYSYEVADTFTTQTFTKRMYSSFLTLVLEAITTIRKKGRLTVTRDAEGVMERWSMAADPLCQFIRDKMVESVKASEINMFERRKLFDQYLKFCEQEQIDPRKRISSQNKFTRDLQAYKLTPTKTTRRIAERKHSIDVYQGPYSWNGNNKDVEPEVKRGFE